MTQSTLRLLAILVLLIASSPSSAFAQPHRSVIALGISSTKGSDTITMPPADSARNSLPVRAVAGAGGMAVGVLAGGLVGLQFGTDCSCDDPNLQQLFAGGLIGGIAGAAIGIAIPNYRSVCSLSERLARTFFGATVGAAAGIAAAIGTRRESPIVVALFPAGTIGGALVSFGRCYRSVRATPVASST